MRCLLLVIVTTLWVSPVLAEAPPVPARKGDALNKYTNRINQEKEAKGALKQKIQTVQQDLSSTKEQLISIATDIQSNETNLKTLQRRIKNLEKKKNELSDQVLSDRKSIARLITTLQRLRRTPPESLFARNQEPFKTAQSISVMRNIIPSIERHAEKLDATLKDLNYVTTDLKQERAELMYESQTLQERRVRLSKLLDKRKDLHAKIDHDIRMREMTIQKISLQAKNLEDLVTRIKKEEKQLEKKRRQTAKLAKKKAPAPIISNARDARLPISGIIRTAYNNTDDLGAKSKGLTIEGRSESLVVAPMNGKISYSGTFKRYGNLVIIEHAGGYHSLIAGLGVINVVVGAHVKSGEPIGSLPNSSLNPRPTVYYELRRNGKPVNPAQKFAQLG